jgi:hypothetical protein
LPNPLMGSCLVEVGHILIQNTLESLLLQDQQVIQAFLTHTSQEAFTDGIGSGRVIGRFEYLDAAGCGNARKTGSKFAITIANEIFRCLPIRSRFPQLLGYPGIGRGSRHADMDHSSCFELDEEERLRAVERTDR